MTAMLRVLPTAARTIPSGLVAEVERARTSAQLRLDNHTVEARSLARLLDALRAERATHRSTCSVCVWGRRRCRQVERLTRSINQTGRRFRRALTWLWRA